MSEVDIFVKNEEVKWRCKRVNIKYNLGDLCKSCDKHEEWVCGNIVAHFDSTSKKYVELIRYQSRPEGNELNLNPLFCRICVVKNNITIKSINPYKRRRLRELDNLMVDILYALEHIKLNGGVLVKSQDHNNGQKGGTNNVRATLLGKLDSLLKKKGEEGKEGEEYFQIKKYADVAFKKPVCMLLDWQVWVLDRIDERKTELTEDSIFAERMAKAGLIKTGWFSKTTIQITEEQLRKLEEKEKQLFKGEKVKKYGLPEKGWIKKKIYSDIDLLVIQF